MFIANDAAIGVGASALLGPVSDDDDDAWFLWSPFMGRTLGATTPLESNAGVQYTVESRGQRRMQSGQRAVLMVENASITDAIEVLVGVSVLAGSGLKR